MPVRISGRIPVPTIGECGIITTTSSRVKKGIPVKNEYQKKCSTRRGIGNETPSGL